MRTGEDARENKEQSRFQAQARAEAALAKPPRENAMRHTSRLCLILSLALGGCSSSPYAPINQATPIRQMDQFFAYWNTPQYPVGYFPERDRNCRRCCCCDR